LEERELCRTFAPLEPAKPLNDAQMCGSFYFYTMDKKTPFLKSYSNIEGISWCRYQGDGIS